MNVRRCGHLVIVDLLEADLYDLQRYQKGVTASKLIEGTLQALLDDIRTA